MIDWAQIAATLAQRAAATPAGRLIGIAAALPYWPAASLPPQQDWCFWQRPDQGQRLLGYGRACATHSSGTGRFAALNAAHCGFAATGAADLMAFLGFAFAPMGDAPLPTGDASLPNASLWVPELLLREEAGRVRVVFACAADQAAQPEKVLARWQAAWHALQAGQPTLAGVARASTFRVQENPLVDTAFLARGKAALAAIAAGNLEKLVLSRPLQLQADGRIDVDALLAALAARHPNCAVYGIGSAGRAFVGASPETLLTRRGDAIAVDALAGTAWQSAVRDLDAEKNRREHDVVAQAVAHALADLCDGIVVPAAPEVLRLDTPDSQLCHLRRRVTARARDGVRALDLIARLHPTPAVGGAPGPAALDWLARHGETRPAWYSGGFGWVAADGDCDIAVALRCGLIENTHATLYAGAGFVAGSDPVEELAETAAKFVAMRSALAATLRTEHTERSVA